MLTFVTHIVKIKLQFWFENNADNAYATLCKFYLSFRYNMLKLVTRIKLVILYEIED